MIWLSAVIECWHTARAIWGEDTVMHDCGPIEARDKPHRPMAFHHRNYHSS